jgi:hypothetical protein
MRKASSSQESNLIHRHHMPKERWLPNPPPSHVCGVELGGRRQFKAQTVYQFWFWILSWGWYWLLFVLCMSANVSR